MNSKMVVVVVGPQLRLLAGFGAWFGPPCPLLPPRYDGIWYAALDGTPPDDDTRFGIGSASLHHFKELTCRRLLIQAGNCQQVFVFFFRSFCFGQIKKGRQEKAGQKRSRQFATCHPTALGQLRENTTNYSCDIICL